MELTCVTRFFHCAEKRTLKFALHKSLICKCDIPQLHGCVETWGQQERQEESCAAQEKSVRFPNLLSLINPAWIMDTVATAEEESPQQRRTVRPNLSNVSVLATAIREMWKEEKVSDWHQGASTSCAAKTTRGAFISSIHNRALRLFPPSSNHLVMTAAFLHRR